MIRQLRIGIIVLILCGGFLYSSLFRRFSASLSGEAQHHPFQLSKQHFVAPRSSNNGNARNLSESNVLQKNENSVKSKENHDDNKDKKRVERKDSGAKEDHHASVVPNNESRELNKASKDHPSRVSMDSLSEKVTNLEENKVEAMAEPPFAEAATISKKKIANATTSMTNHSTPVKQALVTSNTTNSSIVASKKTKPPLQTASKNAATAQDDDLEKIFSEALADVPVKGEAAVLKQVQAKLVRAGVSKGDMQRIMSAIMLGAESIDQVPNGGEKAKLLNLRNQQQQQEAPPPPTQRYHVGHVRDPLAHYPKKGSVKRLPFKPQVPYLGVLVDAGRQYYSISWLKKLIRYLHYMQFNLVHFRLTDDQAFNVQLESHPEFAKASAVDASNGTVYTVKELRELVEYAHARNVTIMPEVNVPGHAGAWHGIPGMLVPCPYFICSKGYGIPLNVEHPRLFPILKEMIVEIKDIFHTSPFFHFGGDEVHMSKPCFDEAGIQMYDYEAFEEKLADVVKEAGVQEAVRWEMTGQQEGDVRLVSLEHYWLTRKYARLDNGTVYPFFASQGLYFDSNQQTDGLSIYQTTRDYITAPKEDHPTAIIAGAFELGMDTWLDRNVMGRLLAVAMGASGIDFTDPPAPNATTTATTFNNNKTSSLLRVRPKKTVLRRTRPDPAARQDAFQKKYLHYCKSLAFDDNLCSLYGKPYLSEEAYKVHWSGHWDKWKTDICDKLTVGTPTRKFLSSGRNLKTASNAASNMFWEGFMEYEVSNYSEYRHANSSHSLNLSQPANASKLLSLLPQHGNSPVEYRGISLDLARAAPDGHVKEHLIQIVDTMAELGFNLLQLRIMDDLSFIMHLGEKLSLQRIDTEDDVDFDYDYDNAIVDTVEYAYHKGIFVMPEISITTRSGGWSESLAHVQCPNVLCNQGRGVAIDLTQPAVWPILSVTIKFLRYIFSSKYIHLGFDERKESRICFDEAQVTPDFDMFEEKLQEILRIERIPPDHVLRWENTEQKAYEKRAGGVTHYRLSGVPTNSTSPWFVSTKLALDEHETAEWSGWNIYEYIRSLASKSPTGIIASVGVIDTESWKMLNIKGRLLAVAMGLSSQTTDYSEKEFCTHYNSTCHSLTPGYHCDSFGKVNTSKSWWMTREQVATSRIQQACNSRTQEIVERTARKGVLVG